MSKIVVFGATGETGQELVKQALEQSHAVTAFVRNPSKLKAVGENLQIIQGDVLNIEDVNKAIAGQDAVLCSLGMPPYDKSKLRTNGTINIINSMESNQVRRLICQTSLGFGDSKEVLPWHMKYILVPFLLKNAFRDHHLQEGKIEKSNLDWTIVRPGNMTNRGKTGSYKSGFSPSEKITLKISRADVAHFMLSQIDDSTNLHKKVGLSY